MKIIVTGSAGFIGSAFVHHMAQAPGVHTVGVDNLSRRGATGAQLAYRFLIRWLRMSPVPERSRGLHEAKF